jgi:hypothetical protein
MRLVVLITSAVVLAAAAGCAGSHRKIPPPETHVAVSAEAPPSPTTWPAYPHFSHRSCWTRPFLRGEVPNVYRVAPSYAPAVRSHPIPPATVARRLLSRLGDRRYVHSITFAPASPAVGHAVHALYAGGHPPKDALKATILPLDTELARRRHLTPEQSLTAATARWESGLVAGALRDDMCAAGGAPLVSWTSADGGLYSESSSALEQRFPNPSPAAFRKRIAHAGRRYGFRVVSLRLLRPEEIAPLLIVETSRSRHAFVRDIPAIMKLLNPTHIVGHQGAQTFEGFLFAAEDAHGPFTETESLSRGQSEGGEWAANSCLYAYPVIGPVTQNQKPCT